jgi:hypothetical protein
VPKYLLRHKTTGYYAVTGEDVSGGFRHTPNVSEATRYDSFRAAELARREFDSFSGAWMVVEVTP